MFNQRSGDFEAALVEHKQELEIAEREGRIMDQGVAHRKLGENLMELKRWRQANMHCQTYLDIANSEGSKEETQRAKVTLGRLLQAEAQNSFAKERKGELLGKAERLFQDSLEICSQLVKNSDYNAMRAGALQNLALVYEDKGLIEKAKNYVKEAITIAK